MTTVNDSIFVMPGRAFFDTLITFSASGFQYDVVDLRSHEIRRTEPVRVSVRYWTEGIPFAASSPNPGDNIKVDMVHDPASQYPRWGYDGCFKGIALVVEREGSSVALSCEREPVDSIQLEGCEEWISFIVG